MMNLLATIITVGSFKALLTSIYAANGTSHIVDRVVTRQTSSIGSHTYTGVEKIRLSERGI